jgi:hypothetical protein
MKLSPIEYTAIVTFQASSGAEARMATELAVAGWPNGAVVSHKLTVEVGQTAHVLAEDES